LTVNGSVILYGTFITAVVTFLSIAFAVYFFIVKPYNGYKARVASGEEEAPVAPRATSSCCARSGMCSAPAADLSPAK
jgi:large conductance mechanosensitive channel